MSRSCIFVLAAFGCQGSTPKSSEAATGYIEVRDAKGAVVASVRTGAPCRAAFGSAQLVVEGGKLEASGAKWTTEKRPNGTVMMKDGEVVARVVTSEEDVAAGHTDVVDPRGVGIVHISRMHGHLSIGDAGSRRLREGAKTAGGVAVGDMLVTGTDSLLGAGLVSSPEVPAEVRALAMCAL